MSQHELKCHSKPFNAVSLCRKTFEYRRNDRNFKEGDILRLREWDDRGGYSGYEFHVRVTYLLEGGQYGIPEGFCIMSIEPVES